MIVAVTGGRGYRDAATVARELDALGPLSLLVHGDASGADRLARDWARRRGVQVQPCPAAWRDRDGVRDLAAGFKRNQAMLDQWRPALVLAFPGGRGTADMVARARRAGVPVRLVAPPGRFDDVLG